MASSDRSPKKGKKKEEDGKNWKSNFVRLVTSCGSGKSKDGKQKAGNLNAAPSTPPNEATWTRIDDDGESFDPAAAFDINRQNLPRLGCSAESVLSRLLDFWSIIKQCFSVTVCASNEK